MTAWLGYVVIGMGVMRLLIGAAPLFAAGITSRLLGFPAAHDTPTARLMARMFGVRDMGLGVLAFYAVAQPALAAPVFLFNAAMDAGDLASISVPLIKRQGIDRAAWLSAGFAVMGGTAWIVVWSLL
ncbi:MAG: hypothetical protein AB7K71_18020 [Polyangiaceae bacterium]